MRILCLNQYGPPDAAPTARLLGDVAEFLRARGHAVVIVSQRAEDYRAQGGRAAKSRLRRELGAMWRLLSAGWRARVEGQRPEVVLALSSPPCLLVLAAFLARRHGAVLAHWAMDLYPELARALGEVRGGWAYGVLAGLMGRAYRQCALVVALDEDMQEHLQSTYGLEGVRVLPPWGPALPENSKFEILNSKGGGGDMTGGGTPWTWLYSGNLGRAHEWETLLAAQRLLEGRGVPAELVFQGSGTVRDAARARAAGLGLQRCRWRGYVGEGELAASLQAAGALVVTQRLAARGLLWPSKLATVERLGRPVLWVGPTDGAVARRLRGGVPGAGIFAPGEAAAVADWVEARFRGGRRERGGDNDRVIIARFRAGTLGNLADRGARGVRASYRPWLQGPGGRACGRLTKWKVRWHRKGDEREAGGCNPVGGRLSTPGVGESRTWGRSR